MLVTSIFLPYQDYFPPPDKRPLHIPPQLPPKRSCPPPLKCPPPRTITSWTISLTPLTTTLYTAAPANPLWTVAIPRQLPSPPNNSPCKCEFPLTSPGKFHFSDVFGITVLKYNWLLYPLETPIYRATQNI